MSFRTARGPAGAWGSLLWVQPGRLPLFKRGPEHGAWLAGLTRPHGLAGAAAGLACCGPFPQDAWVQRVRRMMGPN